MSATVSVRADGRVTVVTIERPERRNAVDLPTAHALFDAFRRFDADPSCGRRGADRRGRRLLRRGRSPGDCRRRAAPIRASEGIRADGADAAQARQAGDRRRRRSGGRGRHGARALVRLEDRCALGGVRALQSPLRRAAVDLGTIRLPRIVGHGRAMELILTGRPVGAEEALRIGLVNELTDDGAALARAARARPRALRLSPDRTAQRPPVGDRAMGAQRRRGDPQRGRARSRDDRQRRDGRGLGPLPRRRRAARQLSRQPGSLRTLSGEEPLLSRRARKPSGARVSRRLR